MSVNTLILNSTNLDTSSPYNNVYKYQFNSSTYFKDAKISVNNINLYYSWFNITSSQSNNKFSYIWFSGPGPTSTQVNITIPDGFYDISSLNSYLQSVMISNGHYLIDSTGNFVYFIEFEENSSYYSIQLTCYALLTSAQATTKSFTAPSGYTFVTTNITPQVVIPSSNSIKNIVGFTAGTYPSSTQTTDYSTISTYCPQVTPVQSVTVTCNLCNNKLCYPNNVLFSFAPAGTAFGSTIVAKPAYANFVDIQEGSYSQIIIRFLDQNFNDLNIRDTNLIIQLSIQQN